MTGAEGSALRLAFDTNILAYAEGVDRHPADAAKITAARRLTTRVVLDQIGRAVPVQTLAELHNVLVKKARMAPSAAAERVDRWRSFGEMVETSPAVLDAALTLATDNGLQIFDAVILAAAAEGRCNLLVSEDLQDGFTWRGVMVADPFKAELKPRLARLLTEGRDTQTF